MRHVFAAGGGGGCCKCDIGGWCEGGRGGVRKKY